MNDAKKGPGLQATGRKLTLNPCFGYRLSVKRASESGWPSLRALPETGVHQSLYGRAMDLRRAGLGRDTALEALSEHVAASPLRAGRVVSHLEIADAIQSAYRETSAKVSCSHVNAYTAQKIANYDHETGWPQNMALPRAKLDPARIRRLLAEAGNFTLADLGKIVPGSPYEYAAPRWALTKLFNENDLLCVGGSTADFIAKPLRDWTDDELLTRQFIVPNPLRKRTGITKNGKTSAHCRDATGPRRYIIVESDAGLDPDQQAAIFAHLHIVANGKLAAIVMSGGKSLHGWFRCDGVPESKLHTWFSYAVRRGADPRLWLPEQFVRLPDGLRENGMQQHVLFLNPSP